MTPEPEIFRLLPLQRIEIRNKTFLPVDYLWSTQDCKAQGFWDELIDLIAEGMKNAKHLYGTVLLSLSGGYDSRTLFAIALKAGIDFSAYTCMKHKRI